MRKHRVVLYNPRAPFFTMPLALLALGSALDRSRYDVVIVDGRLEADPIARLIDVTNGAVCLGISVPTGMPIRDALAATRAVRAARPQCRIVWGGWHPSLLPAETLAEAGIDAVVVGQGERTLAEAVERFAAGEGLAGVAGVVSHCTATGQVCTNRPRTLEDINDFPEHDYDLVDVPRYFDLKGERQLDYVTSQGCPFRCAFCANPTVYRREWFGLEPTRVGTELQRLWNRYRFTDIGMHDETFFTCPARVAAIAEEILRRDLNFTWTAAIRADQGAGLDDGALMACRHAGLRHVTVGVESGSQSMLDWMQKDTRLEQVFACLQKCRRQGIAMLFNLIAGFPDESPESIAATLDLAKTLRGFGPDIQVALFMYRPYPGTPITESLARDGHPLPRGLEEWAAIEHGDLPTPWVDRGTRVLVERFGFYQRIGWARPRPGLGALQAVARWRCRRDLYAFPLEKAIVEWLRPPKTS